MTETENKKHWHALYVKSRTEKKVAARLEEIGIEVYLPLVMTIRQWSDRRKRIEEPLFKSYVFVHSYDKSHYNILNIEGVMYFVSFEHKAVIVPDNQILAIKDFIQNYDDNKKALEESDLQEGQMVRLISGPMTGLEGKLVSVKDSKRLVVYIEAVGQYLSVHVPRAKVEPIL